MATHSSIFAWEVPWTEEPVGLQSVGSHRDTTKYAHIHINSFHILIVLNFQGKVYSLGQFLKCRLLFYKF